MPPWLSILILVSTVGGLMFAAFSMWLKFQENQTAIGTSARELGKTVATQQKALEAAERRIQNLEAIVTNPLWDAVHDGGLQEAEKLRSLSKADAYLDMPEEEPSDTERAAQLARRLKT